MEQTVFPSREERISERIVEQTVFPSRSWTFQFMVVVRLLAEVLKTLSRLSRDRVQLRLVVVFKIFSRNRFQRRFMS